MTALDSIFDEALQKAITGLHADSGTIQVRESEDRVLRLVASHAIPGSMLDRIREIPWGKGPAGLAAERGEAIEYGNLQTSTASEIDSQARATGIQAAVIVPMTHGQEVVGTIGVGRKSERPFTEKQIQWLLDLGRTIGREIPLLHAR